VQDLPTIYTEFWEHYFKDAPDRTILLSLSPVRLGSHGSPLGDIPVLLVNETRNLIKTAPCSNPRFGRRVFQSLEEGLEWLLENTDD
jgi:hypothetical protein